MPYINVDGKKLFLSDEECAFLRIYKGSDNDEDYKLLFGENASYFFLSNLLSYSNINKFLNFLNNPSDELLNDTNFNGVSKILDMSVGLINVASNYAYVCGPIKNVLYRSEDLRNLSTYEDGFVTSFKSTTSKEIVATTTFNYENTDKIAYKVYGYCPYIFVDKCIDGEFFGSEAEYLFPPYINCSIKDEKFISGMGSTFNKVIEIHDDFSEGIESELEVSDEELDVIIGKFQKLVLNDKANGKVSDEVRKLAKIINANLKCYARYKYGVGKINYDLDKRFEGVHTYDVATGSDTMMNVSLSWDEKYRGLEDAVIQYYQEPDRDWGHSDTLHIYTLSYMIDNGLFNYDLLNELYGNSDVSKLDSFFLDGNYKMSDEDYSKFLELFNIMAGYGEHGKDELFEVKNEMSGRAITILYNSKSYGDLK